MFYDAVKARQDYIDAGCTPVELEAIFTPAKQLVKVENGALIANAARERKDAYIREVLDPQFMLDNPNATATSMTKLIKKDSYDA